MYSAASSRFRLRYRASVTNATYDSSAEINWSRSGRSGSKSGVGIDAASAIIISMMASKSICFESKCLYNVRFETCPRWGDVIDPRRLKAMYSELVNRRVENVLAVFYLLISCRYH